jgi:hypothetical protein
MNMINFKRTLNVRTLWLGIGLMAIAVALLFTVPLYREWQYQDVADIGALSRVVGVSLFIGIVTLLPSLKSAQKNS